MSHAFVLSHLPFLGKHDNVIYRNECILKITKDFRLSTFDSVFIFGDLNYRVNTPNLLFDPKNDQLRQYIKASNSPIKDYKEKDPTFPPTCKLKTNREKSCQVYKEECYDKKRTPSWCDRIIYKSSMYKMSNYQVVDTDGTFSSDHMPVLAIFNK